jgi:transposase-like protein
MKEQPEFPETLTDAIKYFADPDRALEFMKAIRWPDGKVTCPRCQSSDMVFTPARRLWRCRACQCQPSVKVGTIFEESPLGLDKWLPAMWMILNAKNGISSCELARALGVTQKTAWFMLHRLRLAIQDNSICKFAGNVEVDETFIGGKARNMHKERRKKLVKGSGNKAMQPVMGVLQRNKPDQASRVVLKVVKGIKRKDLQGHVHAHVEKGAEIHTDALKSYNGLEPDYVHKVVDHAVAYVQDNVHTNGLENFWSLLKRTIRGTYVSVEPFHLFRYLDEQAFRFNERKNTDAGRFLIGIVGVIGKRLKYAKLISEAGSPELPTTGTREAEEQKGKRHMRRKLHHGLGWIPLTA